MQVLSKHFVDGHWVEPYSNTTMDIINPATEAVIAQVTMGNAQDTERAIEAACNAFPAWSQVDTATRKALLLKIADLMELNKDALVDAISTSMGCPAHIASWLQVEDPIRCMRLFAEMTDVRDQVEEKNQLMVMREPVGVCGLISPWNYPLHQMVSKVGAALAAGCTMVVKPSEQTPLQDFLMADIMKEAGLPAGVFNVVPGTGPEVGSVLSSHPLVDMVSFTGSTRAGIEVAKSAAPTVKRVAQELGGKSPLIITESADLDAAVKYGVEDVMLNSGQTCTALTRMLVPESCYVEAVAIAEQVAGSLALGMQDEAFLGPMVTRVQQQRVLDYIQIGIDEGARLVCGGVDGSTLPETGYYVAPTIFANVNNEMRIAQEEIFGPVLCMIPYRDIDHAISLANDTPYGLSSGVYAGSKQEAVSVAKHIRAGMCCINGGVFNCEAPFGGYKQSGNGRELSDIGVSEFLEVKSLLLAE